VEVHFDGHCFGCGQLNPDGLQLKFEPQADGTSAADYIVPERFQSWAGMAHGGIVSLMLDEAVGWAAWHAGHPGVTGRLQVSLRRPLKLGEPVRIAGRVENVRRTLVYVSAFVENRVDHSRIADATATLMEAKTVIDPTAV
jgi:acyl-coenzyme A thioesterase PaaI-like protein